MQHFTYRRAATLGLGTFGINLLWSIYNAQVPIFLQAGRADFSADGAGYNLSTTQAGFIMSLDNLAALLILPYVGALSDRTRTRLGRRRPYILAGAPLACLTFIAIPLLVGRPLPLFLIALAGTLLTMDLFRTPLAALLPDLIPSAHRSQTSGVINLMGGLGAVLGFLVGGRLFDLAPWMSFAFGAVLMLASCVALVVAIREPAMPAAIVGQAGMLGTLREVATDPNRSTIMLLGAIFCWYLAYSAVQVFWTSFASTALGLSPGQATSQLAAFSLAVVVCALPSGLIGGRIGHKRTILGGVIGLAAMMLWGVLMRNPAQAPLMLALAGASWSLILVNGLPMVVDLAPEAQAGAYSGIYFIAVMSASIIGPTTVGAIIQAVDNNYRFSFIWGALVLLLAAISLLGVRSGAHSPAARSAAAD